MLKAGISPRPASWILERSIDGIDYSVWQYFGTNNADCLNRYNQSEQSDVHQSLQSDTSVICSTKFSKPIPENGEVTCTCLLWLKTAQKLIFFYRCIYHF